MPFPLPECFWVTSIATVLFGTPDIVIVSVFVGAEAA